MLSFFLFDLDFLFFLIYFVTFSLILASSFPPSLFFFFLLLLLIIILLWLFSILFFFLLITLRSAHQVSHPFACRKPTCSKCCSKFSQTTKQPDTAALKPASSSSTSTSPSMTPPNPRGDPGVKSASTFHCSNSVFFPFVTPGAIFQQRLLCYSDTSIYSTRLIWSKKKIGCLRPWVLQ